MNRKTVPGCNSSHTQNKWLWISDGILLYFTPILNAAWAYLDFLVVCPTYIDLKSLFFKKTKNKKTTTFI